MEPTYLCPDCGAPLIVARKESRSLKNRYGRTRPALWKCPTCKDGRQWFSWAPEIQPTGTLLAQFGADVDDCPF